MDVSPTLIAGQLGSQPRIVDSNTLKSTGCGWRRGPHGGRAALLCTQHKDSLKEGVKFYFSVQF